MILLTVDFDELFEFLIVNRIEIGLQPVIGQ
jgi:hypothetical protein